MDDTEPRDEPALAPLVAALDRFEMLSDFTATSLGPTWRVTFHIDQCEEGWITLEFLAWWVRDLNRSGSDALFYASALPPWINGPGTTLFWVIEDRDLGPAGAAVEMLAASLERAAEFYEPEREPPPPSMN